MSRPTGDFTAGLEGDFSLEQMGEMAQPVKRLPCKPANGSLSPKPMERWKMIHSVELSSDL